MVNPYWAVSGKQSSTGWELLEIMEILEKKNL